MITRLSLSTALVIYGLCAAPVLADGRDEVSQSEDNTFSDRLLARAGFGDIGKSYALIVGINEFDEFNDLPTDQDPIRIRDYLINEAGFDYVHLLTGDKVTKDRLEELMLDEFRVRVGDNDRFLFYWSGHGETLKNGAKTRGFLPLKSSKKKRFSTMVSMEDISDWDSYINAHQVLYLMDSCFSGLVGVAPQSDLSDITKEQLSGPSRHVITAGRGDEQTIAVDQLGGSVFTHALLRGLRGSADSQNELGADGLVTVGELKGYLGQEISRLRISYNWTSSITPQIRDLGGSDGAFFFPIPKKFEGTQPVRPVAGNRIGEVQETLKLLGHDPGPITGTMTFRTVAALILFQRAMGLGETGEIDKPTLAAFPRALAGGVGTMGGDASPAIERPIVVEEVERPIVVVEDIVAGATDTDPILDGPIQQSQVSQGPISFGLDQKICENCPNMTEVIPPQNLQDTPFIPRRFYISETEVTVQQFETYAAETGLAFVDAKTSQGPTCFDWTQSSKLRKTAMAFNQPFADHSPNHPVSCISRDDAQGYIDWLNEDNSGPDYRLPTTLEYQFLLESQSNHLKEKYEGVIDSPAKLACKLGNFGDAGSSFPWRNPGCSDGQSGVAYVASFEPDAFGVYDIAGNLWEWTSDCWPSQQAKGKSSDVCTKGTLKGGSYDDPLKNTKSDIAQSAPTDRRQTNIGFRIARDYN